MKQIAFIGGFDKFDLILYTAIIISNQQGARCLIVDSTDQEKARYIVPTVDNSNYIKDKYITTFQGIDVAVGFKTKNELRDFGILKDVAANIEENQNLENDMNQMEHEQSQSMKEKKDYDYMFIDLDNAYTLDSLELKENDLIFLTTAFDLYSLNKAFRVLDNTNVTLPINKILFGKKIKNSHITYMEAVTGNRNINWGKYNIEFPYDNGDWTVIHENQRENRLSLTKLSTKFKSGLKSLVRLITEANVFEVNGVVNRMQKQEKNKG